MKRDAAIAVIALCGLFLASLNGQQPPNATVAGLKTAAGLTAALWAAEPQLSNPTNIAIDERGRVWVLEAVNYRRQLRHEPDIRPEGDRILILEDAHGTGHADTVTVFDQNPDIRAPLGIAVLGDKVIVSQSPNITIYTKDSHDRIVNKEVFLTGFKGVDHDHGVHAVVFGPDGRYYFDAGNEGWDVTDRTGTRVAMDGSSYFQGASFRVNPDGTGLEVVAYNFRNPYELALDSFGGIFQTDNDDDGNAWTRLNEVIEGGNYGFRGPLNRTWREDRGTHFHVELPGVMPNIARLGAGAPCGLVVYEGTLLPDKYRGQLLHAEAGKRLVTAYLLAPEGAGRSLRTENLVSASDTWFRPSDVAVAPDGSLFIADWYDPIVGGHGMGDPQGARGRIYRVAPTGVNPSVPPLDLESAPGLTAALRSPNQDVFYLAHSRLAEQGRAALPLLRTLWHGTDSILRARALWIAGALGADGGALVHEALDDPDPRFRVLGLRVLARAGGDMVAASQRLLHDPSPHVRREILVQLRDPRRMAPPYLVGGQTTAPAFVLDTWIALAQQYDGKDRWYLESLGIASRGREDALYAMLRAHRSGMPPEVFAQLLVELRPRAALPDLIAAVNDAKADVVERVAALDALGSMQWPEAARAVEALISSPGTPAAVVERAFRHYSRQLFSMWPEARKSDALPAVIEIGLSTPALQPIAIETVGALGDARFVPQLLTLARSESSAPEIRAAALDVAGRARVAEHAAAFEALATSGPLPVRIAAVRARGLLGGADARTWAQALLLSAAPNEVRSEALRVLARSPEGLTAIVEMAEQRRLPIELTLTAAGLISGGPGGGPLGSASAPGAMAALRARAAKVLPVATAANAIPSFRTLDRDYQGDAAAGRRVFDADGMCAACHSLGGPRKLGPDLSAIGEKFGKAALLDAIVNPSEAIAPEYEVWVFATKGRGDVTGLIVSDTPDGVVVATSPDERVRLAPSEIVTRRRYGASMMPEGLLTRLTPQQIADLLEFLSALKSRTP